MAVDADEDTQPLLVPCGDGSVVAYLSSPVLSHQSGPPIDSDDPSFSPQPDPVHSPPEDPWFPFLSKPHMQLCLLYHGSHRKNLDQVSLQAVMDILKVSV